MPASLDLAGLGVVMAIRYDDDEPGSPWTFPLYVDDARRRGQREALVGDPYGRLGGTPEKQFPWVWKASDLLGWRATPSRSTTRRAGAGSVRAST